MSRLVEKPPFTEVARFINSLGLSKEAFKQLEQFLRTAYLFGRENWRPGACRKAAGDFDLFCQGLTTYSALPQNWRVMTYREEHFWVVLFNERNNPNTIVLDAAGIGWPYHPYFGLLPFAYPPNLKSIYEAGQPCL